MYRLVTCPETAHLELIEHERTPFGLIVTSCSRFRPACAVECPRTCAARLDRRAALPEDPQLAVGDVTTIDLRVA